MVLFFFENRYLCKDGTYKWLSWSSYPFLKEEKNYAVARDITKEKNTLLKLEISENRFRQIAESNQAVIWEIDNEGVFTYVSPKSKKIWGYAPSDLIGKFHVYDLAPKANKSAFKEQALKLLAENKKIELFQNTTQKPDGSLVEVLTNAAPFFDYSGKKIGYRGSDMDITAKIIAEKEVFRKQELLTKLAEQVPGVLYQFQKFPNGKTCFPYSSGHMRNIYWVNPEEIVDDAEIIYSRLHPDDLNWVMEAINKSADELSLFQVEFRVINPFSKEIEWRQSVASPQKLEDGSVLWHGIISNITQRKEFERNLQESEERFKKIIDYSSDIVIMLDKDRKQTLVSPIAEKITGFKPDELIGKSIDEFIHPDDVSSVLATYQLVLDNPRAWHKAQYRHMHKTKGWIWLEGSAQNFLNYPEFNAVLLSVRDISENKQKELEMKKLTIAMEQSPATIVITNLDGDIEYANPKFEEITGYSRKEVLGKNPKILKSGLQNKAFYDAMWNTLTNGKTWRGELCNKKKNGDL